MYLLLRVISYILAVLPFLRTKLSSLKSTETATSCPLAIVGVGVRLPGGVKTDSEFWDLLVNKRCARRELPPDRYNINGFYSESGQRGSVRCKYAYCLDEDISKFDAEFFNISPVELARMDPQQRLLLKVVWECMESGGQVAWQGRDIGCFVGVFGEDWLDMTRKDYQNLGQGRVGGTGDFALANRVSYHYDLTGPSCTVRTACSPSLVGLDMAQRAIATGECSSAIVAGTSLLLTPTYTIAMTEEGALCPDGKCKTFDASANGYARGEAINAIYVKKLEDAIRDNDPIRGVIRGTGTNSDGKTAGLSTPSAEAQAALIQETYEQAGIPDTSQTAYIEAHGTGTSVGDRTEAAGIAKVFGEKGIIMGAVKPNLGHSEGASGLTGLIKAVLALEHKQIPPNINFSRPNPGIPFEEARLKVPTETLPWPVNRMERVSVNSFGIGGVNAHTIVEAAPSNVRGLKRNKDCKRRSYVHVVSADSMESLADRLHATKEYLANRRVPTIDVAYTLGQRRDHMVCRGFVTSDDHGQPAVSDTRRTPAKDQPLAFVFNGQGAQWAGMASELLWAFPSFRSSIEKMDMTLRVLEDSPSWTILDCLADAAFAFWTNKAEFVQPLCTALQIALVDLLAAWNIKPATVVGHSSGEIAAAYAMGSLTAEEAITIAFYRGKFAKFLVEGAVIACENSPHSVTISGEVEKVEAVDHKINLARPEAFYRRLQVNIAYHSHHMKAIGEAYRTILEKLVGTHPPLPYSTVSVDSQSGLPQLDAAYWQRNLESPVRFCSAVQSLLKGEEGAVFVEIGPHSTLAGPLRQIFSSNRPQSIVTYIPTLVRGKSLVSSMMATADHIFTLGVDVNLGLVNGTENETVLTDLPLYSWQERTAYWEESRVTKRWRFRTFPNHELLWSSVLEASDLEPAWRNILQLEDVPWLEDHRVGGDIVFPGAGYIAMVGEAVRRVTGIHEYTIHRLHMNNALLLHAGNPVELITNLRPGRITSVSDSAAFEFTISSFANNHWTKHCTGFARAGRWTQNTICRLMDALPRRVNPTVWYRALSALGLTYGPTFQGLEDITVDPTGGNATATVDGNFSHSESFYHIHPTIIDQCLQLMILAKCGGKPRKIGRPVVPKAMTELQIAPVSQALRIQVSVGAADGDVLDGRIMAFSNGQPALQMEGCTFSSLDVQVKVDDLAAAQMRWAPHIDLVRHQDLFEVMSSKDAVVLLEQLTVLCVHEACDKLRFTAVEVEHFTRYKSWLEAETTRLANGEYDHIIPEASQWSTLDSRQRGLLIKARSVEALYNEQSAPLSLAIESILENIEGLAKGEVQPLELLTKNNVLSNIYTAKNQMDSFFATIGHTRPTIKVLEIGAGTGSTTARALRSLVTDDAVRMYSQYTFTDISPGFFATAKEQFQNYEQVDFRVLDITKDIEEQGFSPHSFDLIIADNVLHATPSLHATLRNVRRLLAPGGTLFLQELCTEMLFIGYIMGTLPGWWLGSEDGRQTRPYVPVQRWDDELRKAGFTGVDSAIFDDEQPYHVNAYIISSPVAVEWDAARTPVTLLYRSKISAAAGNIERVLIKKGYSVSWQKLGKDMPAGQLVVSLLDLEGPFFHGIAGEDWNAFVAYVTSSEFGSMIWITKNCQIHCNDPRYSLVLGVARIVRFELSLDLVTVEVDEFSSQEAAESLEKIIANFPAQKNRDGADIDPEYAIVDGTTQVPRYFPYFPSEHVDDPEEGTGRKLCIDKKGSLNSLSWAQTHSRELDDYQIEIRLEAVGLNFKDVLIAMGIIGGSKTALGLEGSGTVTRTGPGVTRVQEGDRVMTGASKGCFSSRVIMTESLCVRIPDNLSFEDAATMPSVFLTAIHSLIELAKLQAGETILIHSACGGVGQAAIQISQMIGAEVRQAYRGSSAIFADKVRHDTDGRGVDVVLNSLSGELLHASWRCVASFGTMVELGKRDFLDYGMLSMNEFADNRNFSGVDLSVLIDRKPHVIQRYLQQCADLLQQGHLKPIYPNHVFDAIDVVKAFRYMQGGQHIGKIVVKMPEGPEQLPTNIALESTPLFASDKSYLLVGGLGGLGRAVSAWMIENGARHLVYLSPTAHTKPRTQEVFRELQALGGNTTLVTGTVTDIEDIRRAVDLSPRPIAGVLHMPMVLRDRSLVDITIEDWEGATAPKVQGAWNLHTVFDHSIDLDFFLLISSIVGHQGNWGLTNYAAGGTLQDALTRHRRALGLPANVIDVGVMGEVGFVSEDPALFQKLKGVNLLLWESEVLQSIRVVLSQQCAAKAAGAECSGGIADLLVGSISKTRGLNGLAKDDVRVSVHRNLSTSRSTALVSGDSPLKQFLNRVAANPDILNDDSSLEIVTGEIVNMVCSIMSLRKEDMDVTSSLTALGLDSLVSVEIRRWWRQNLGLEISVLQITSLGSVQQLGVLAINSLREKYLGDNF
ncbi:fatty acid synthase S-acetyltransferase [Aspergillus neoniger CBS 115656]|uniref:Fatty acid synthase S-acetyltransferase n=1 Tax=Aspergillus neoniger (strain CBS 115656) TaxID=1448310 RepID=A0A318Z1F1_ASPNB|nr:fatty acid synthase S-acetyltransferase [Aspergillus neoniger CBS 115656]PYH30922.1 fatty acid synthase S-acetyltransferase [Aspergillus neoniger CBS 115656]